ncbi:amino acid adenylation domain-containing protein [Nocardia sp. NPDC052566]|uniref:amino acid adenylation domain-containing protein n=1 Tax=Nocardia sp. NPDC052566 TaxID=3364330 RepID=UPI0037CB1D65
MNAVARAGVLPDLLERFADARDRDAVVVGDHRLTFGELDTATAALAARLSGAGLGPGRVAVIRLRQSTDTMVAMIAALRAGGAWCVIEPDYPDAWLRTLLRDIDCGAILYDGATESELGAATAALAPPDRVPPVLDIRAVDGRTGPVADRAPEQAPAYVITTSGSTGTPKAVVVSRGNLANLAASRNYPVPEALITCSALRFTWDGALIQSIWTLCLGGAVVLPDHRGLSDPEAVARLVRDRRCSHLYATPSFYRLLLPYLAGAEEHLGTVALAGEVLAPDLAHRHREMLPGVTLINEYGPTEATGTVLAHEISGEIGAVVPLGVPLGRSAAYLLTDRLSAAADGEHADLVLGGPQVADGYAGRPGDTAARFVADPCGAGARMYRTGDHASRDANGDIVFHGRADGQVKVRGARVECDAVAGVLRGHPGLRDAIAFTLPDRAGDQLLAACWVADDAVLVPPTTAELIAHCRTHLPAYSIPERLRRLDSLPLAPSGKVDIAAVRAAMRAVTARERDQRRARWLPAQREVAEIWDEVLEHDDFDLDDPFLAIGGNSWRVVELHIRLERRWPGALRVGQLFDEVTVRAQAEIVSHAPELAPTVPERPVVFEL